MAWFKLGEIMTDIRGSVRNHVYSVWKGRHYLRTNAELVGNPQTDPQADLRRKMSELSKRWNRDLDDTQRAGWESYAKTQGSKGAGDKDKGGEGIIPQNKGLMSGVNAFCMTNFLIWTVGGTEIDDAPMGINPPTIPEKGECEYDPVNKKITVPIIFPEWGPPREGITPDGKVRVWVQPPKGVHSRIEKTVTGAPGESIVVEIETYRELDTAQPLCPGKFTIQADAVNSWGLRSGPSAKNEVVLPQPSGP